MFGAVDPADYRISVAIFSHGIECPDQQGLSDIPSSAGHVDPDGAEESPGGGIETGETNDPAFLGRNKAFGGCV